jgi:thioredoxin reductase (NADPH)
MDQTGDELTAKAAPTLLVSPLVSSRLTEAQLVLLGRYGEVRPTAAGQVLFREGDRGYDFVVVLSGAVTITDHQAGVQRELATGGPGEFMAELSILTGERLFTTAVVTEPGSVLVVPMDRLRELIGRDQELGELILHTTLRGRG